MFTLPILLLVATTCEAIALHLHRDCGSKGGILNSVHGDWCKNEPCTFTPGTTYTVQIIFTAVTQILEAHQVFHVVYGSSSLPLSLQPENLCGHGLTCPVQPGDTVVFYTRFTIPAGLQQMNFAAKLELKDQNQTDILCLVGPMIIKT